jgi:hypothetical protein
MKTPVAPSVPTVSQHGRLLQRGPGRALPLAVALLAGALWAPAASAAPLQGIPPDSGSGAQTHGAAQAPQLIEQSAGRLSVTGDDYRAEFSPRGLWFQSADGGRELGIEARWLRRGAERLELSPAAPVHSGVAALYPRGAGITERFEPTPAGIEHSLSLAGPIGLAGDLAVDFDLSGSALDGPALALGGGWNLSGVSIGELWAIDAAGARTQGRLELDGQRLSWVIPGEFVERATWPLLLDPLIGSGFQLSSPASQQVLFGPYESDSQASVAYDQTTDSYLAVWTRLAFNPNLDPVTQFTLLGQRFSATGQPLGNPIPISSVSPSSSPAVVSVNRSNRFAVAWVQDFFGESQVRVRLVEASTGNLSNSLFVQGLPLDQINRVTIAGEPDGSLTATGQVWLAWDSPSGIRGARVLVPNSPAQPTIAANFTWVSGSNLSQPALARTPSASGRLGLAWVASANQGQTSSVWAGVFTTTGASLGSAQKVSGNVTRTSAPRIDGGDAGPSYYTVVFEGVGTSCDIFGINCVDTFRGYRNALSFNGILQVGTPVALATEELSRSSPSVGWRNNRMFLTYQEIADSPVEGKLFSLRLLECDPKTGAIVDGPTTIESYTSLLSSNGNYTDTAVCLDASGGDPSASRGVLLYSRAFETFIVASSDVIRGRFLSAFSPLASAIDFGGACGLGGGAYQVSSPPAVGNGSFRARLLFPGTGTSVAVFNLAFSGVPIPCGTCQWVPFEFTTVLPGNPNLVELALPIPCNPALIGIEVLSQWTVIKPSANDCPSFPGFAVSNILSLRPH